MGTILLERSCSSMERIYKTKIGFLVGANSGALDYRLCSGLNLFNLFASLKFNKGARLFYKHGVWVDRKLTPKPSPYIYEPLLGENREVGEIPDSTLTQNPRLI